MLRAADSSCSDSLVLAVERFQEAGFDQLRHKSVPYGQQEEDDEREDHLHVGPRRETEEAHDQQLRHLTAGELVDFALRHSPDVVIRWIGGLYNVTTIITRVMLLTFVFSQNKKKSNKMSSGRCLTSSVLFFFVRARCRFALKYLFHEEERDALEHLIPVERRDGHVEEEAIEYGRRYVG